MKEITMISRSNAVKEAMRLEAIKICNDEVAVDEVMATCVMKSLIQDVVKENIVKASEGVQGLKKMLIRFKEDGYNYDIIILGTSDMLVYQNEKEKEVVNELFIVTEKEVYNMQELVYLGYEEIIVA